MCICINLLKELYVIFVRHYGQCLNKGIWAEHVAHIGEMKNLQQILSGKLERKCPLRRVGG
jgi:hypothetical protein